MLGWFSRVYRRRLGWLRAFRVVYNALVSVCLPEHLPFPRRIAIIAMRLPRQAPAPGVAVKSPGVPWLEIRCRSPEMRLDFTTRVQLSAGLSDGSVSFGAIAARPLRGTHSESVYVGHF